MSVTPSSFGVGGRERGGIHKKNQSEDSLRGKVKKSLSERKPTHYRHPDPEYLRMLYILT